MITADLYSTDSTRYVGYTTNQYTDEMTKRWLSADGGRTVNDLSAYWLGWISKDNLPALYRVSAVYFDSETGDLHFDDITNESNFPCGYVNGTSGVITTLYSNIDGVDDYRSNNARLLNNVHPEFSGLMYNYNYAGAISITGRYILYDGGGNIIYPTNWMGYLPQVTILNNRNTSEVLLAYRFIYENAQQQFKINYNSTDYFFTCTLSDFSDGTAMLSDDTNTVQARIFISEMSFGQGGSYNNGNQTDLRTSWCCKVNGTYGTHTVEKIRYGFGYDANNGTSTYTMRNLDNENPALGWYSLAQNVVFPADIVSALKNGSEKYHWIGNVCGYHLTDDALFFAFFTADDIKKSFSLFYRVALTFLPGYIRNVTYATDVNANNEFLAKLKTGDLSDTAFKSGLREWQYTDFQADDFDEEDIPPYVPPEPPEPPRPDPEDPGEDETGGDDAKPNDPSGLGGGFRFTTQYALSATHLRELGAKLWQGFGNINNYINNFTFNVDPDTGSVNFADIMQFFISLRAYPCPISAMATTSAGGTDMRIGSGATPIELTTNFSIVDSYIGQINAGSVSIPFWYGDYRDYSLEIIAYLPYCGTVELNPGDVMGGTLNAFYTVDLCTGACMGFLTCTTWENKTIWVGAMPGQLGAVVPLTATNAGQVAARMYGDRINFADTVLGVVKSTATGIGAAMSGNLGGFAGQMINATVGSSLELERQNAGIGARGAIAAPMLSGGRGFASFGTSKTAYVQIRSPFYAAPANYAQTVGNPSTSAVRIGDCTGFARFVNVDVTGITTDADDQQAIRRALESGVII